MNAFFGIGIVTAILYGLLIDGTFFKLYFVLLIGYICIFQFIFLKRGDFSKRKNLVVATWGGKTIC
jgi:hypothetical protein